MEPEIKAGVEFIMPRESANENTGELPKYRIVGIEDENVIVREIEGDSLAYYSETLSIAMFRDMLNAGLIVLFNAPKESAPKVDPYTEIIAIESEIRELRNERRAIFKGEIPIMTSRTTDDLAERVIELTTQIRAREQDAMIRRLRAGESRVSVAMTAADYSLSDR